LRSTILSIVSVVLASAWTLASGPELVRIRVLYTKQPVRLEGTGPYQFGLKQAGTTFTAYGPVRVRAMRKTMVFGHKGFKGEVLVMPVSSTDTLKINGRRYRGTLVFHPLGSGRYDVVETVDVDEYVYGVLPREVETSWPPAALKAQAVVSRSYAVANKSQDPTARFDLSDSVFDQVYGGMDVESPESNRAVDNTHGEVLVGPSGKPVVAYFHSSCGGRTELPQHVWKTAPPDDVYGNILDTYCQEDPHYLWKLELSYATIRQRLRRAGVRLHDLKKIAIVQKSLSGRAEIIGLQTSRGVLEISGNRFRLAMGADALRSTLFVNVKQTKKSVLFEGHGWGHGAGLCQWGAHGRAMAGQDYKSILKTYFPKAKLASVDTLSR
jgi:stage II sporulation protein D